METWLESDAVGESVGNGEASAALQLGQDDDDLSVKRRNTVHSPQLSPGGHHVVGLLTVTPHLTHLLDNEALMILILPVSIC